MGTAARSWALLALGAATAIAVLLSGATTAAAPEVSFNRTSQFVRFGTAAPNPDGTTDTLNASTFTLPSRLDRGR